MDELQLSPNEALVVRAALLLVRDSTPDMPAEDMLTLRQVIAWMMPEGTEIVLRREPA